MKYTPRDYIHWWLHKKDIKVDERGNLVAPDGREFNDLCDTMYLDYLDQVAGYNKDVEKDRKVKTYAEKEMIKAVNELISLEITKKRDEVTKSLACTGENLASVTKFTAALTGRTDSHVIAVLSHFIWMIKRRLNNKEVVFHIMPIIYGKQGAGKSYAIEKLLGPLTNLTLRIRVTELTDARFFFSLNKNFVAFLDEMAGASKADVEVLKNQITATYNDARKLNTNNVSKIKQNCSLIGATNKPVSELIYDPTGARRFYEIRTQDKLDWEAINAIDYIALFQGIDENKERGYIEEHLEEISRDQESLIGVDELADFLAFHQIGSEGLTKEVACAKLYDTYKTWTEENGVKPLSSSWFGRKVANKGVKSNVRRIANKIERFYLISENSPIHKKSSIGDPLAATGAKVWS